jgi:hypothetical protein
MLIPSLLTLALLSAHVDVARRCEVIELLESPRHEWDIERVSAKVDSATQIVRVRAALADSAAHTVSFEPLEWIRGVPTSEYLVLPGVTVGSDDYNRGSVPYHMVRPSGLRGSCFAKEYRLGEQYLLLLRTGAGRSPVYWWPLGPMNEQLRGDDDPWLLWVRERARRQ